MTISGQKIYAPKGVAVLVVNSNKTNKTNKNNFENQLIQKFTQLKIKPPSFKNLNYLEPIFFGGGQEKGLRSSTENLAGIAAFSLALEK